jgi:hypothetical protein
MRRLALLLCLVPGLALADSPPSMTGELSPAEANVACAEALPLQRECKVEFCDAMVELRLAMDPKFKGADKAAMKVECAKEIEVDGTGDLTTRTKRCEGWAAARGPMKIERGDKLAMDACWKKATCGEKVGCWKPIFTKVVKAQPRPPDAAPKATK